MDTLPFSPSAERNKGSILAVLRQLLPTGGTALEIASGTGQHAAHFAAHLPGWTWQATEADAAALPGIAAWMAEAGVGNVLPPLVVDVTAPGWASLGNRRFDAIICANMLHIAPWAACTGLMQGAGRHLAAAGMLVTYGPYLEDDLPTAPSNLAFDQDLRSRNPAWGIRRLAEVCAEAGKAGLALRQRHAMPANNLLLVFGRTGAATAGASSATAP